MSVFKLPWWSVVPPGPVVGVEIVPRLLLQHCPQHRYLCRWFRLLADGTERAAVGSSLRYTPCAEDVGNELLVDCVAVMADGRPIDATRTSARSSAVHSGSVLPPPDRRVASLLDAASPNRPLLSVLSYNILAPCLASERAFPYVPPWALDWKYRCKLLHAELSGLADGADVICLQEVQPEAFDELRVLLPEFDGVLDLKQVSGGKVERAEGVATLWRRQRLQLIAHRCMPLSAWSGCGQPSCCPDHPTAERRSPAVVWPERPVTWRPGCSVQPHPRLSESLRIKGHVVQLVALGWRQERQADQHHQVGQDEGCDRGAARGGSDAGPDGAHEEQMCAGGGIEGELGCRAGGGHAERLSSCGICVANTHLHHSPAEPQVKVAQAAAACRAIHRFREEQQARTAGGAFTS